jgi:hypothetical protein
MDDWTSIGGLLGGIGLFLLGMELMTGGLKLAAGPALERILANSTRTRLRGLASGVLVTALVQSSSALSSYATGESPNTCGVCSPAKAVRWQQTAQGQLPVAEMDARLRTASILRRAMQQAVKAALLLDATTR